MGILEDQFRRAAASVTPENQGRAALLQAPPGGAAAPLPAPVDAATAPRGAALLNTPSPGQRLRAQAVGTGLSDAVAARNVAPAVPPAAPPLDPRVALNAQPGATLADTVAARSGPPTPGAADALRSVPADTAYADTVTARAGPPTPGAADRLRTLPADTGLADAVAARNGPPAPSAVRASLTAPPSGPSLADTVAARNVAPAAAVDPRAAFNAQPGQALAQAQEQVRTARNINNAANPTSVRAAAMAPPGPELPVTMDQKLGAANLRYGAPDTAYAEAVAARAGGAGAPPVPPAGGPPAGAPAAGPSAYARFMEGASAQKGFVPPGGATIAKAATLAGKGAKLAGGAAMAAGGAALPYLGRAASLIEPVIEAGRVVNVAADPESSKADVATQAAEGVGRGAATIAGGMAGAQFGTMAAPFLGPLAPAGPVVGGIVGGGLGYFGGDHAIKALRGYFGLDTASPSERTSERNASIAAAAAAAAAEKAKQPAAPKAQVLPAGPVMTGDQADQYSLKQQARQSAKATAPAAAPAAAAPAGPDPRLAQYQSLQQQQNDSPIARTVLGGGESAVYYKDGSRLALTPGQPMPADVAQFHDRHAQLNALRSGQALPGAAQAAPAPAAPAAPAGKGGVADKVNAFAQQYGAAAAKAGAALGVNPDLLLAQWGHETGWGKSVIPGTNNLGNIKAGKGQGGVAATDNGTGSRDKYMNFNSPEAFADHYANYVNTRYKGAAGSGADMARFAGALKAGGYAEDAKYAPKLSAALATLMKHRSAGQPEQAVAAAPAAAVGAAPQADMSDLRTPPVQVIKGMQQSVNVPNASGYDELPKTIFDAARRDPGGFADNGVASNYLANINQGYDAHNNPTGAKLAEQALQNQGALAVANTTGQYGVQGHQIAAQGAKEVATMNAEGSRHVVVDVDTGQRDAMGQPIFKKQAIDTRTNQAIGAAPAKQAYPAVPEEAIQELRKRKGDKVAMDSFITHFGVEQFNKYKDGK